MNKFTFRQVILLLAFVFVLPSYSQDKKHYVSLNQNETEWTITHGDDVLFHGTGHVDFNNMPPFIKYVVDSLDAVKPVNRVKKNAGMNHAPATTIVEPLITTSWDQGAPYNDLIPTIDGVHVPAGCSTISTAQVVNYYRYMKPWTVSYDQTTYTDPEVMEHKNITKWYDPSEVSCPMPVYHVDYSFNGWSDNLSPAELCEAIAFAQQASFSSDETGTFLNYQSFAIQKRFGYLTEVIQTDFFNVVEPLKAQLNQQRPVIINAADKNNTGHSFIADGYNSEGEFHLNLGWGESWNCWSTPELWAYNQGIYAITLYPDYNDEGLFVKEDEAGTAVFHNLTTGEVFKQEMELAPTTNALTGLFVYASNIAQMQLSAGEYEYCLEYKSGKQISVPMPVPSEYELYTFYSHYSPSLVKGTSRLSVPYDCRLTFYSEIDERFGSPYGLQVILEFFQLESCSVGEVELNLTNRDSTLNVLIPTEYFEGYNPYSGLKYGNYYATIENIPAGYYQFSANVHSETLGEFSVGIGAGAIPCTGNDYRDLLDLDGVLWRGSIYKWTDASNPYVEPLMFKLPRHNTKGSYTLDLSMGTGAENSLVIYAKWVDELDENGNVIYVISPVVEEGTDITEENAEDITEFKLTLNNVETFEVNEDASAKLLIDGILSGTAGKDDISVSDGVVTINFNYIDSDENTQARLKAFSHSITRASGDDVSVEVIIAAGSFNINGEDVTEDISYSYTAPASVVEEIEETLASMLHGIAAAEHATKVYNLKGIRVNKNQKGIVIKNGKTFFVK